MEMRKDLMEEVNGFGQDESFYVNLNLTLERDEEYKCLDLG